MSNLYKQRYTVTKDKNTRVINSNEMVAEKLQSLSLANAKKAREQEGFIEGLGSLINGSGASMDNIPAEEPEATLEEIREEAKRLIEEAREQAGKITEQARKQAEDINNEARQNGLRQGLADAQVIANEESRKQEAQFLEKTGQLEEDYKQKMEELEPRLVDVICNVFEKVFHVQFDDKKEILLYLIQNAIMNIEGSKEFQIRVCEQNYQFLESHKTELMERIGNNLNIELLADPFIKDNQCVIETDSGVFECGLGVQLENLIKAIRSLCL